MDEKSRMPPEDIDDAESERLYTYAPHISAGVISIEELKALVESMEELGASKVKLGGEAVFVWEDGDTPEKSPEEVTNRSGIDFKAGGVRPVKMCSAETFCERYKQPVLSLAKKLDDLYFGQTFEAKVVIGVAGCQRSCSEPATKDIGIIATAYGYDILVGGNAGMNPRIAVKIHSVKTVEEVIALTGKIIDYVKEHGSRMHRLGAIIEKRGMEDFRGYLSLFTDTHKVF